MKIERIFYWAIVAATIACFVVLAGWGAPKVAAEAGGLPIFDARFRYSYHAAEAFLAALTNDGRKLYYELRLLDTIFPVLLAVSLGGGVLLLTRGRRLSIRLVALIPPIAGAVFDLSENALVAEILQDAATGVMPDPAMVAAASYRTSMKWISDYGSLATVASLYLVRIQRARRRRKARR